MASFEYEGRDQAGRRVTGIVDANDAAAAAKQLVSRHITPLNIKQSRTSFFKKNFSGGGFSLFKEKVTNQNILDFSRQMHTMVSAGVPIIKAVHQLAKSSNSKAMQKVLEEVAGNIEAGKSLATTLGEQKKIFPSIYISLISVGESTGHLEDSFLEAGDFLESSLANKKRLITAIRYPIIVIFAIIAAMLGMNFFVVPKFATMFKRYGAALPLPTRILIASSEFLQNHWMLLLGVLVGTLIGIKLLMRNPIVRYYWDKAKLSIPIVGSLARRIIMAQFSRSFSMVLTSGVAVLKGLDLAASVAGNVYITKQIQIMRTAIDQGESITNASTKVDLFNPVSLQMLEVGDTTGKLDEMLGKIADAYEADIDYDLKRLTDTLEPILLAAVGGMIVILALAVYLPMWDLIKVIK